MILKEGKQDCQCGMCFEWKTIFLGKNEVAVYRIANVQANVCDQSVINGQYHITARCPNCNAKHFITLDI